MNQDRPPAADGSPLDILWEDEHGLAVNKPPGLLTQPRSGDDPEPSVEAMVRRHLSPLDPAGIYLGTLHRLDRPVSGVVVWAKNPRAARRFSAQFAGRLARKEYWAIVDGFVDANQLGRWADWLSRPDLRGRARVVSEGTPGALPCATDASVDPARPPVSGRARLILRPETGRTHQLRAQAGHRGLAIVGDSTYGSTEPSGLDRGIALHARSIELEHPVRKSRLRIVAEPPGAWNGLERPGSISRRS